jgi:hypothetical protein
MLPGEGNGASFNKPLSASVCGFFGKAIYGDYISYKNALICVACGKPVIAGQSYRKSKKDNTIWHKRCFENARFCGITGHYIKPGVATVRIGSEIFLKKKGSACPKTSKSLSCPRVNG